MSQIAKPSSVFTLALVGVAFEALGLLMLGFGIIPFGLGMMGNYGGMMGGYYGGTTAFAAWWIAIWLIAGLLAIGLGIYGLKLVSSSSVQSVRTGSVLFLVSAVIAFPTMWGLLIGSALLFIASIIGLTWQPMNQVQGEKVPA